VLGSVPNCNTDDLNLAVESAKNAFEKWSNQTAEVSLCLLMLMAKATIN
jgi:acyl-CoA reductase-like NAD-dependent aldehyde dehydrogenase